MHFASELVNEIRHHRSQLLPLFQQQPTNPIESALRTALNQYWQDLPSAASSTTREFAVDSSSAVRTLVNGTDIFITRALMLGSDGARHKKLECTALRGIIDPTVATNIEILMRDLLEIQIILDNLPYLSHDLVLIDGNLYGRYTHLMQQFPISGLEHLPLLLFEAMQNLFSLCQDLQITVIGVSKSSKTRALSKALLVQAGYPPKSLDIPDVEMLYRWKRGETGYTTPLLLGGYALSTEAQRMYTAPEAYLQRYFRDLPSNRWKWGVNIIRNIPVSPAIAMCHVISAVNEPSLRLDIPASCLGLSDRIRDVSPFRFVAPTLVKKVLQQLLADRGGRDVHNALLYVVDREVRLSSQVVDTVYKSILGNELNMVVEYDRSLRRFYR